MITENDLQEAIAECEWTRNPNANTCIKLAAFYTIKNELFGKGDQQLSYSYATGPAERVETFNSDTEFGQAIAGMSVDKFMPVVDELMTTLKAINPRLYDAVLRKLSDV